MSEPLLSSADLTSDNIHLSRATKANFEPACLAENDFLHGLPEAVSALVRHSLAPNSRRAYLSDLAQFERRGGTIPCDAAMIASYLAESAERLAPATLIRHLAAISKAHRARGFQNPTTTELVRATLKGIRRTHGRAQKQATPLLRDDLGCVIDRLDNSVKAARDRALLLIGFAGALRRAELVALDVSDIEHVKQGIVLHLRRSKTDQEGLGQTVGIPFGRTRWCPVSAMDHWLDRAALEQGPVFRLVNRHGRVQQARLSSQAVSSVIKERVAAAGFDPTGYSGHSLRAGLATSAAQTGISSWKIRQQTRHASDAMLARYIRSGELFADNAAGALL